MNVIVRKLLGFGALPDSDIQALVEACNRIVEVAADRRVIDEGDRPGDVFAVLTGWACRYKILKDGSRQILAFLMPGDFCDLSASVTEVMDHSIGTLTPVKFAQIPRTTMEQMLAERPALTKALLWAQIVDEGILRTWLVSLGRRDAYQRVAHLLCELWARLKHAGLIAEGQAQLPLTQTELADALGLTPVHTNRTLKRLREEGIIRFDHGFLVIPDTERLASAAGFNANYLHRPGSARFGESSL